MKRYTNNKIQGELTKLQELFHDFTMQGALEGDEIELGIISNAIEELLHYRQWCQEAGFDDYDLRFSITKIFYLYFDGGTKESNPGPGYGSFKLFDDQDELLHHGKWSTEIEHTNNESEYRALANALSWFIEDSDYVGDVTKLVIYGDSNLVRQQVGIKINGEWQGRNCNDKELREWRGIVRDSIDYLNKNHIIVEYRRAIRDDIYRILGH